MLKTFLTNLRKQRAVGSARAIQQLQPGWNAESEGVIKKEFKFDSFEEASNFILRYTEYCNKISVSPSWFNVYNTVKIQLSNTEFGQISTKEVQVAKYLDLLHDIKLPKESDEALLSFEQIVQIASIDQSIETVRNNQNQGTPLLGDAREMLRLTQA
ncbi:hypothetical protein FGO68_gene3727 [Halteria grandinella]|uniref:4a-hydroxytetrahydrobiopterin dehydratase n=1 Tax=Halteria grandinella TaxID=5974 RepID=A0A8J8SYR6_HALGN|nr:hypothetical protein FGO68_gene3727 [Halteria grandinella]